jgi:hypothetical protein
MKLLNKKPMKIETIYRIAIVVLLGGILSVQVAILNRIPKPITTTLLNASNPQSAAIEQNIPLVRIAGNVDVNVQNSVEVHTKPFTPLEVTQ